MRSRVDRFEEGSCEDLTIRKKLVEASRWPFSCGIGHISTNFANGTSLTNGSANTPYELTFEATSDWETQFDFETDADGNQVMWYDQLKRIPSGSTLFTIKALTAPPGHEDSRTVTIGTIQTATDLFTSVAGDERLFFGHNDVRNDRDLWPDSWNRLDRQNDPRFD